jgi:hypothetical protein
MRGETGQHVAQPSLGVDVVEFGGLDQGVERGSSVDLGRSTLAGWVGQAAFALRPLVDVIARHVLAADKIHGDDTTVPVLAPGTGKTKTVRLWVYVRDDRPWCRMPLKPTR